MFEVELGMALGIFGGLNESIDLRAILARRSGSNQFEGVLIKIRLSPKSVTETETMYKNIEKNLGKVDHSDFKIIQESRPIGDLNQLLSGVQNMRIKLHNITELVRPFGTEAQNILENKSLICDDFSNEEESLGFETIGIMTTTGGQHLEKVVKDIGVDIEKYIDDFEKCRDWLGVNTVTTTASILVLFHVPIKKLDLGDQEINKCISKYHVHKLFLTKLSFNGSYQRLFSSEPAYRKESDYKTMFNFEPKIILLQENKGNFTNILVCFDEGREVEIQPTDRVTIRITYSEAGRGDLRVDKFEGQQLLPKEPIILRKDTLLSGFRPFTAYSKLRFMLTKGDPKQQTRSLAWCLSILDWSTIELANMGEEIKQNGIILVSADILSFNPHERILLVIDCTIRSSEADSKINEMNLIPDYVKLEALHRVVPLIVCRQRCISDLKAKAKNNNVLVLDMNDLDGVLISIESGHLDQARSEFLSLILGNDNHKFDLLI